MIINIGHKYINLDNIGYIETQDGKEFSVLLYFVNVHDGCITLKGEDAKQILRYLDRVSSKNWGDAWMIS